MCGIAGLIEPKLKEKERVIGNMVKAIIHRGPDDDGFFVDKYVGLGMRRLSIIDLKTGRQPVTSEDGNKVIFFNGEIYNYQELTDKLLKLGYNFKTHSDTEAILHLYEEFGEKMLPMLRGMFSFCIYDLEKKEIFIARDFFGIKPLYYLTSGENIVAFSSEIKSFLLYPSFNKEINQSAVYNYLAFQYNPLTETFFKGVYKLPPAHYLKIDVTTGKTQIEKYWSFEFAQDNKLDQKKTADEIRETIKDSVGYHMIADVPVGAFLSGGIDSSIIATSMQEIRGDKKIKTFTVGFESLSEEKEATETSNYLNTDHTQIKISGDEYFKALQNIVYHFDEPVADPSAVGLYFLAKEARKSVKVVLSGEGADELFGGYNIYLAPFARQKLLWLPNGLVKLFANLPFKFYGQNYLKRVSQSLEDWYIGNASVFKEEEIKKFWKGEPQKLKSLSPIYKNVFTKSESTQMQYVDINTWLVGDILAKADKMTMANSLELRVPFLDKEVADLAATLPDRFKWNKGVTKYLLREAFAKFIPESTRNRKKLGFPTPIRNWLTKDRVDVYNIILKNEYIRGYMDVNFVRSLIDNHVAKKQDNSRKIYTLLMLALWYDTFIK
jgi:asparagine synthase (glutamine-hydrolysing)